MGLAGHGTLGAHQRLPLKKNCPQPFCSVLAACDELSESVPVGSIIQPGKLLLYGNLPKGGTTPKGQRVHPEKEKGYILKRHNGVHPQNEKGVYPPQKIFKGVHPQKEKGYTPTKGGTPPRTLQPNGGE